MEKVTTLFLHLYPACVMWATRWYPGPQVQAARAREAAYAVAWEEAGFLQLVVLPMVPYLLWGVLYYIKVGLTGVVGLTGCGWVDWEWLG